MKTANPEHDQVRKNYEEFEKIERKAYKKYLESEDSSHFNDYEKKTKRTYEISL